MLIKQGLTLAIAALVVLAAPACGSKDASSDEDPAIPPRAKQSPLGPFFGECGSVTDEEVRGAVGQLILPVVVRNSSGCVWESPAGGNGPSVSFSWYRGSPIARERAGSDRIGRPPEDVTIAGHKGFLGSSGQLLCEIALQYGDDFFHWSISFEGTRPTADACQAARKLAELSASRVQK